MVEIIFFFRFMTVKKFCKKLRRWVREFWVSLLLSEPYSVASPHFPRCTTLLSSRVSDQDPLLFWYEDLNSGSVKKNCILLIQQSKCCRSGRNEKSYKMQKYFHLVQDQGWSAKKICPPPLKKFCCLGNGA